MLPLRRAPRAPRRAATREDRGAEFELLTAGGWPAKLVGCCGGSRRDPRGSPAEVLSTDRRVTCPSDRGRSPAAAPLIRDPLQNALGPVEKSHREMNPCGSPSSARGGSRAGRPGGWPGLFASPAGVRRRPRRALPGPRKRKAAGDPHRAPPSTRGRISSAARPGRADSTAYSNRVSCPV